MTELVFLKETKMFFQQKENVKYFRLNYTFMKSYENNFGNKIDCSVKVFSQKLS